MMLLTEEQAKEKMCFRSPTFGASQQLAEGPGPNCIGSACMAWRIHTFSGRRFSMDEDMAASLVKRYPATYVIESHSNTYGTCKVRQVEDVGFCGLAGMNNND